MCHHFFRERVVFCMPSTVNAWLEAGYPRGNLSVEDKSMWILSAEQKMNSYGSRVSRGLRPDSHHHHHVGQGCQRGLLSVPFPDTGERHAWVMLS